MKITKKKIINISLIMLMVISFSIFAVYEIKNKGKVEKAQPQQESTVPQEVLDAQGDDEKELNEIFKYYKDNMKRELFEKYFVKNIGEDVRFMIEGFRHGLCDPTQQWENRYEYKSETIYPVVNVKNMEVLDTYKGEVVEDGKTCIKLTVEARNTSDKNVYFEVPSYLIGLRRENHSYENNFPDDHYMEVEYNSDYTFYKRYKGPNDDPKNGVIDTIGVLPCDEGDGATTLVELPPKEAITYYEYYKVDEDWIGAGNLAYGCEGYMKQRMNGSVNYMPYAFVIYLYPENRVTE